MVVSFAVALYFQFAHARFFPGTELALSVQFLIGVAVTTVAWVGATLLTRPTDPARLREFCRLARPGGPGWPMDPETHVVDGPADRLSATGWDVPSGVICMIRTISRNPNR